MTDGLFAYSRNPMYARYDRCAWWAFALLVNRAAPWLVPIGFYLLMRFAFVAKEEVLMAHTFGEAYADYRAQVRRWF